MRASKGASRSMTTFNARTPCIINISKTRMTMLPQMIKHGSKRGEDTTSSILEEPEQKIDMLDNNPSLDEGKYAGSGDTKDTEMKPVEDQHLETVEKFKKRSERFKPLPSEKDIVAKKEGEPLQPSQSEALANPEIKLEQPFRGRRWISS
ncbi:hypothetical protein Droror1_Dr00024024 [Drosera rotundifolia]